MRTAGANEKKQQEQKKSLTNNDQFCSFQKKLLVKILREIDRRVRFLIKRLEAAEVVESAGRDSDQVFFGATVRTRTREGQERGITIVGVDETDSAKGRVSWISPVAKALIKAREGDKVVLQTPGGVEELEILEVSYDPID